MGGACQGPTYGPYTKRVSEDQEDSLRRLEKIRDEKEHTEESLAAIEKLIQLMKGAIERTRVSGVDMSAEERNMMWRRRNPHLLHQGRKFPDHFKDHPLGLRDLRRLDDHSDEPLVEGDD